MSTEAKWGEVKTICKHTASFKVVEILSKDLLERTLQCFEIFFNDS